MANKGFSCFQYGLLARHCRQRRSAHDLDVLQHRHADWQSTNNNITSTGYFNAIASKLKVGDFIFCPGGVSPSNGADRSWFAATRVRSFRRSLPAW